MLIVDDDSGFRSSLVRIIRSVGRLAELDVVIAEAADLVGAVARLEHGGLDVLIVDVRLGSSSDRSGLLFLEYARTPDARGRAFDGPAFVLTALDDYDAEARADALNARYVPKENLNVDDFASRVLSLPPQRHRSGTRLKSVSEGEVAEFLAEATTGLHAAVTHARKLAVRHMVDACAGNRTAAARKLRISRQQVQSILAQNEQDADLARKPK